MQRRPLWLWIVLGFWLAALAGIAGWLWLRNDEQGEGLALTNHQVESPIPPAMALAPAAKLDLAFRASFGASGEARRAVGDHTYVYRPERLEWIGNRAMLISLGRNVEDCHACAGAMAIHYLRPEDQGLRVTGAWLETGPSGGWGNPPGEVAINRQLSPNPVVTSSTTDGGQGFMCTVIWLVELGQDGPVASDPIPIASSNAGAVIDDTGRTMGGGRLREVEGRMINVRRGQGFDVAFTGSERFTETYRYSNGRFVRPSQESRAGC